MREKKKTGRGKRTTLGREERKSPRARKEPSLAMYTTFFPISPVYSDGPPLQGKLGRENALACASRFGGELSCYCTRAVDTIYHVTVIPRGLSLAGETKTQKESGKRTTSIP